MSTTTEEKAFDAAERARRHAEKLGPGPLRAEDALSTADGSMTDALLAARVAEKVLNGEFLWSKGLGWMRWNDQIWERRDEVPVIEAVRRYMVETVIPEMAEAGDDWRRRTALAALLGKHRLAAITSLARGPLEVDAEDFDAHPHLLNTPTGIVDLRTGKLGPHDPELMLTKITTVGYVSGATHQDWNKALQAVPQDCHTYLQMRIGQAATGFMTPDDVLVVFQGGGENGKTTVLEAVTSSLGTYQVLVSKRALLANPGDHPTELMDFRGARMAFAEELPEGHRLSVERLKDVIGTPRMKARHMRQDTVEWDSTHSMFISTNYLPVVEETDHGTWRRLQLLEFPYRFLKPHEEPTGAANELRGDPTLRQRLKEGEAQREAVLAWIVGGAKQWFDAECVMPEAPERVRESSRRWRMTSDSVLAYWDDRLVASAGSHVMGTEILGDFNEWLRQRGQREWSDRLFSNRFGEHNETKRHLVVQKRVRVGETGLSRPSLGSAWESRPVVPKQYTAFLGVKFNDGEA